MTLPLTAVLVRLTMVLPITLYTRRVQQRQLDLQPLLRAWQPQIRAKAMREKAHLGPQIVYRNERKAMRLKRIELYKRWNCGFWKNYLPLLQLPVFLLFIESIRSLSGASQGLLGLIWNRSSATDPATENLGGIGTVTNGNTTLEVTDYTAAQPISVQTLGIDPTMATEGALWFPDLTAADPMLVLPFMLSATMFLNIFSGPRRAIEQTLVQKRIMRALGMVALAAGPLCLHFPSGMLVYWISSSMTAYAQAALLDRFMPLKRSVPLGQSKEKA